MTSVGHTGWQRKAALRNTSGQRENKGKMAAEATPLPCDPLTLPPWAKVWQPGIGMEPWRSLSLPPPGSAEQWETWPASRQQSSCPPFRFRCRQLLLMWDGSPILSWMRTPKKPTYLASKPQIMHTLLPASVFLLSLLLSHVSFTFCDSGWGPLWPLDNCIADRGSQATKLFYLSNRHSVRTRAEQEPKRPTGNFKWSHKKSIPEFGSCWPYFLARYPQAVYWISLSRSFFA